MFPWNNLNHILLLRKKIHFHCQLNSLHICVLPFLRWSSYAGVSEEAGGRGLPPLLSNQIPRPGVPSADVQDAVQRYGRLGEGLPDGDPAQSGGLVAAPHHGPGPEGGAAAGEPVFCLLCNCDFNFDSALSLHGFKINWTMCDIQLGITQSLKY